MRASAFSALRRWRLAPVVLCVSLLGSVSLTARADTVASVDSPGNVLRVSIESQHEGRLSYRIDRGGTPVLSSSRLGFLLGDGRLERNLEVVAQSTRSVDETWEQPWGERRVSRNRYTELRVEVRETAQAGRRFNLVFRVYDDGVGFRYEFP